MDIYYDDEADFLEINVNGYREGFFKDVGEGISERVDEKTGKITGIAIMGFRKRMDKPKDIRISLPVKLEIHN